MMSTRPLPDATINGVAHVSLCCNMKSYISLTPKQQGIGAPLSPHSRVIDDQSAKKEKKKVWNVYVKIWQVSPFSIGMFSIVYTFHEEQLKEK